MRSIYLYDDSEKGFYTAVFEAWKEKDSYLCTNSLQLKLEDCIHFIENQEEKYTRVMNALYKIDKTAREEIYVVLKSFQQEKSQICYLYLREIFLCKKPIRTQLNKKVVTDFLFLKQTVTREIARIKGFLRFTECENKIYYAPYSPDNDITELLMPHFTARFKNQSFIIHDINRKTAAFYRENQWFITTLEKPELYISQDEDAFCSLWQEYYQSVNIEMRKNTRQMKSYMPVRYWKFLPEKHICFSKDKNKLE